MKRIIVIFLCLIFLTGCTFNMYPEEKSKAVKSEITESTGENSNDDYGYIKSVWLAYFEIQDLLSGCDEMQFSSRINEKFGKLKNMGFNTVTVQVRAFADAIYPSKYFPPSPYCLSDNGSLKFDVFKIICNAAKKNGLNVEAWINPYRIQNTSDIKKLNKSSIALKWLGSEKKKSNVYVNEKGVYFNPASNDVTKLIVNGVKEIVENYNLSAVHFDDYFYPTVKKDIDKAEYKKYKNKGGKLALSSWRRENINNMVKSVYKAVKKCNKKVKFGISPASDMKRNKNELYADVEKWVSHKGYIDYICPQVYFGFLNVYQPFMFTVKKWMYISKCDIYIGLPLYKSGKADKYAAKEDERIINEFINNNNIIARQITYLSKLENIKGFYIFSFSSIFDKDKEGEVNNMLKAMQSSNPQPHRKN